MRPATNISILMTKKSCPVYNREMVCLTHELSDHPGFVIWQII